MPACGLSKVERTGHMHVEHLLPLRQCHLVNHGWANDARVVDESVDGAEFVDALRHCPGSELWVCDATGQGKKAFTEGVGGAGERIRIEIDSRHARAQFQRQAADG